MNLDKLKGHIPDTVIAQIPSIQEKFQINICIYNLITRLIIIIFMNILEYFDIKNKIKINFKIKFNKPYLDFSY
jgi:hypothetical protein